MHSLAAAVYHSKSAERCIRPDPFMNCPREVVDVLRRGILLQALRRALG